MPLSKAQLQTLVYDTCTQQGAVSVPGPVLKELVDNYLTEPQTDIADIAVPASATAEDVANKINAVLAALRLANVLTVVTINTKKG